MASSKAVWGIDLGQCALKAIKLRFDSKEDKAVAEAFDFIEHPKILSQPDAEPEELIRGALEKFLSRNDVEGCDLIVSIPGQSGLSRFVKLPPVEAKKIPDIVQFEARQQIPFPLEEVVWDYQRIGAAEEQEGFALETEVALFAIKKDAVNRYLAPYQAMGMQIDTVQLAPVALYNFAAFDYFYHGRKAAAAAKPADAPAAEEEEEAETVVLLDMGADKTDVVISDGDTIWLRSLPIGGNHFTRALTKELKLTFAKAEHLKRNATKTQDPKKLFQAMRQVFQDFASELQKSITYFSGTHRHHTIKKVIGMGNGFRLPGLQKFLQQNLQYEVVRIPEFRGLSGEETLTAPAFSENLLSYAVAYGLALQGLHQTPIQTNLLPREIQLQRMIRDKKSWSLLSASLLLVGCLALFYGNWRVYKAVHSDAFKEPEQAAKSASMEFQKLDGDYKQALQAYDAEKKAGEVIVGVENAKHRLDWIKVFKVINDALPDRAPLDDKSEQRNIESVPEINVEYIVAEYVSDLSGWANGIEPTRKSTMSKADQAAPPAGPGWVFKILGYTFYSTESENGELFLTKHVLSRFQAPEMKQKGISHAVLRFAEEDPEWTPASQKQDKLKSRLGTSVYTPPVAANPVAAAFPGFPGAAALPPGESKGRLTLPIAGDTQVRTLPDNFHEYTQSSVKRADEGADAGGGALPRTDFEINLVWSPAAAEQAAAAASSSAAPGVPTTPSGAPPGVRLSAPEQGKLRFDAP